MNAVIIVPDADGRHRVYEAITANERGRLLAECDDNLQALKTARDVLGIDGAIARFKKSTKALQR